MQYDYAIDRSLQAECIASLNAAGKNVNADSKQHSFTQLSQHSVNIGKRELGVTNPYVCIDIERRGSEVLSR